MATKRAVESKLRELIGRLDAAGEDVHDSLAESLPDRRIIEVDVPDLETSFWTEMSGGRMGKLHPGAPPSADIRIRVDSDHLVSLIDGKRSLFSSYLGGQVKIEASFGDLLRLRKLA
ncbi:MAG TPA: SCP2 sterol-binding domain-containing protein [Actinomycetota bacterium]|nr:SCP2 sterol-binding domain-containing protein [Actinomycetota bacterium]